MLLLVEPLSYALSVRERSVQDLDRHLGECKPALKNDPLSALNFDPPIGLDLVSVLDSPALVSSFNNVAMMRHSIE